MCVYRIKEEQEVVFGIICLWQFKQTNTLSLFAAKQKVIYANDTTERRDA